MTRPVRPGLFRAMLVAGGSIVNVADGLESFDHRLVFKNGMELVERARGIGQILLKTFGEYQLGIAYCLGEDEHDAVVERMIGYSFRSHDRLQHFLTRVLPCYTTTLWAKVCLIMSRKNLAMT